MSNRVDHITIVGGGTAGWMTACMLVTVLNERSDGPPVRVTLIESPNVPTVGVGEATVPGMPNTLRQLRIDEADFIRRCNASFKCGVNFINWTVDHDGRARNFVHPFNEGLPLKSNFSPAYHFHKYGKTADNDDMVDALSPNALAIDRRLGPRRTDQGNYQAEIGYAYHLDASLFALFLRVIGIERGVEHVVDDVVDVHRDERGFVRSLQLERSGEFAVEFVVDCTGFRSLIMGQALEEPFEPWGKHLLCDRALALQIPHLDQTRLPPCTTATALGAGWVWTVPLYSRIGTGYVFSSAFRSDDEAIAEFVAHLESLGHSITEQPRVIPMRVGRMRRSWVNNCLAVGLSSGFVEPLEATAIYTTEATVRYFLQHYPDKSVSPALADHFNRQLGASYDNILEFIVMHYYLSNRTDSPFWVAARSDIEIPEGLKANLSHWRHILPSPNDISDRVLFGHWSYIYCLHGKGFYDGVEFPIAGSISKQGWSGHTRRLNGLKKHLIETLPPHYELVRHIRSKAGGSAGGQRLRAAAGD